VLELFGKNKITYNYEKLEIKKIPGNGNLLKKKLE